MKPYENDIELQNKIQAHKEMRKNKNFITCEYYTCDMIDTLNHTPNLILLECMSNLLANEMFVGEKFIKDCDEKIISSIKLLSSKTKHLIIVSNDIFHDGSDYDEYTLAYMSQLGIINQKLADISNQVIEVVFSIPIQIKDDKQRTVLD